jgi:hypothetical protein
LLDDAIARLPALAREAIVRRFYQQASLAEVARALGTTAEAARKRVTRAVSRLRRWLSREGVLVPQAALIERLAATGETSPAVTASESSTQAAFIAEGTTAMITETRATEFPVVSAEFDVADVEANITFFEQLGFTKRWQEQRDASGLPRASLAGGSGRIWLRRAAVTSAEGPISASLSRMRVYFWINGGADALERHRQSIRDGGIAASEYFDDHTLRSFTVATPDGYVIGFFTSFR